MLAVMVMLYNWIWKNEYTPKRWERRSSSELVQERRQG